MVEVQFFLMTVAPPPPKKKQTTKLANLKAASVRVCPRLNFGVDKTANTQLSPAAA